MKNLVIGNTSQFSHYINKNDSVFISSREKNLDKYKTESWDNIILCFGESRKFIENIWLYEKINVELTKYYIENFKDIAKKIYVFSTCELWNRYSGQVSLELSMYHWDTPYLNSKKNITEYIFAEQSKNKLKNVVVIFPFNFNSPYRKKDFLFGKIYNSILNKEQIIIGNTYFYRDIISPFFLMKELFKTSEHKLIGSGRLVFVNDFIRDLYKSFDLNYNDYVFEDIKKYNEYYSTNEYYLKTNNCLYSYDNLLQETVMDLINYKSIK